MLTLNIITGILNSNTITLPIEKFLSLSKFMELDIEDNEVKIGEPIVKVNSNNKILSVFMSRIKQAIGIIIKKGSWKKIQAAIILIITTNSKDSPLI